MHNMISVIIATKNGAHFISKAIESVLSQTFATESATRDQLELIIVNDGSTDNTAEIITQLQLKDTRIKLISFEKNIGPGLARNEGIKKSQGTYVAFIDDDDVWLSKDKLSVQSAFLNTHADYSLVGATHIHIVNEHSEEKYIHVNPSTDEQIRPQMLQRNCFANSSVLVRKSALDQVGYFKPMYLSEDYDLWLRIGLIGKMANLDDCDIAYMVRAGNASNKRKIELYKGIIKIVQEYKNNYPGYLVGICRAYGRVLVGTIQNLF